MRRVEKVILKVLGWMLVAVLLFVAGLSVYNRIKIAQELDAIKEKGYYNPVSTGDHSLNVYVAGNEEGDHTIVALSGWSDGEMYIGWRPLTSQFEDDNEFVFIDRAGYGLSDDVRASMTIEYVVEDYRAALANAGIEGPYILLAHSLGSLYTAYWESTYPDEIEACIIMDGTIPESAEQFNAQMEELSFSDNLTMKLTARLPYLLTNTGLSRIFDINTAYADVFGVLDPGDLHDAFVLLNATYSSHACLDEIQQTFFYNGMVWTYDHIVTNDIPKVYIASSDYEGGLTYAQRLGNTEVYDLPGDHVIFLDRTEECAEIIADFLSGLDA